MTTKKLLWILSATLLMGFIVIQCIFLLRKGLNLGMKQPSFVMQVSYNLIFFIISGILIGALIALIPFKKRPYTEKILTTIPSTISIILILYFISFGYALHQSKANGTELYPVMDYEDIKIPANLNCSLVHDGRFEDSQCIFERKGNKQLQTTKKTQSLTEFTVQWVNDGEYVLSPVIDSLNKIRVKIISVEANGYGCYVNVIKKGKQAFFAKEARLK